MIVHGIRTACLFLAVEEGNIVRLLEGKIRHLGVIGKTAQVNEELLTILSEFVDSTFPVPHVGTIGNKDDLLFKSTNSLVLSEVSSV